jgi:hypothetical protein
MTSRASGPDFWRPTLSKPEVVRSYRQLRVPEGLVAVVDTDEATFPDAGIAQRRDRIRRGKAITKSRATTTKATLTSRASWELWLNADATEFGPGGKQVAEQHGADHGDAHGAAESLSRAEGGAGRACLLLGYPGEHEVLVRGDHHPAAEPGEQ